MSYLHDIIASHECTMYLHVCELYMSCVQVFNISVDVISDTLSTVTFFLVLGV